MVYLRYNTLCMLRYNGELFFWKNRRIAMENGNQVFEQRKAAVLSAAREQGIIDVVQASKNGISIETVELATMLMEKHGPAIYKDLAERRKKTE